VSVARSIGRPAGTTLADGTSTVVGYDAASDPTSTSTPAAEAVVSWCSAEDGGRRSGPSTAPVYAATAIFVQGGEQEVQPGWPASADQLTILLEETGC
jgi:YD repeat-containing protein